MCEEVLEHADDGIGALPHVTSFIDQVIIYLSGNGALHKESTLPWSA